MSETIPPAAPPGGPYTYRVLVGLFPDRVLGGDGFDFAIVP